MSQVDNQEHLLTRQYKSADNLKARIALHERFGKNKVHFHDWLYDHLTMPDRANILEVGTGSAAFWKRNAERIPQGWTLTLSDLSEGMLGEAKGVFKSLGREASFLTLDVQAIPFEANSFDMVMANHMLYHVPDIPKALAEIRRVLKPSGRFYGATNGEGHMLELGTVLSGFVSELDLSKQEIPHTRTFSLENGAALLEEEFETVKLHRPEKDDLVVTEAEPLLAYILSMISWYEAADNLGADKLELAIRNLKTQLEARINVKPIRIRRVAGLFEAY